MENNQPLWILGHKVHLHPTTGDYDLALFETPANSQGPPPHTHNTYEESFLILDGEMEFFINGQTRTFKSGESVDMPPGTLHTFTNTSDRPCTWVNIHSPKGFSAFFTTFGISADENDAIEKSISQGVIQKVLATAKDFDMTIPPPPEN